MWLSAMGKAVQVLQLRIRVNLRFVSRRMHDKAQDRKCTRRAELQSSHIDKRSLKDQRMAVYQA